MRLMSRTITSGGGDADTTLRSCRFDPEWRPTQAAEKSQSQFSASQLTMAYYHGYLHAITTALFTASMFPLLSNVVVQDSSLTCALLLNLFHPALRAPTPFSLVDTGRSPLSANTEK